MNRLHLSLEFAEQILPVVETDEGAQVIPLKPIAEVFGLDWMTQYRRMQNPTFVRRLGVCIGLMPYAGQSREMLCIRLDRVATYLNTCISVERVRAAGNEDGADFLERKQEEWDNVIHEYEARSGTMSAAANQEALAKSRAIRDFVALSREKRMTDDQADRQRIEILLIQQARGLGLAMQADLLDDQGAADREKIESEPAQ